MKKIGYIIGAVHKIDEKFIVLKDKNGSTFRINFTNGILDSVREKLNEKLENNQTIGVQCKKEKDGFTFIYFSAYSGYRRTQITERIKAEAELEAALRANYSPVRGKKNNIKAAKYSFDTKDKKIKIPNKIKSAIRGSVSKSAPEFLP